MPLAIYWDSSNIERHSNRQSQILFRSELPHWPQTHTRARVLGWMYVVVNKIYPHSLTNLSSRAPVGVVSMWVVLEEGCSGKVFCVPSQGVLCFLNF